MYDWLYVYNQFVAPLPDTFAEFSKDWNSKFPHTYDNKVYAKNCKLFYRTSLGELYDKCTNDEKLKHNLKFRFDVFNGFGNYEGTALLSHYHEAAYDAHMTGLVFAHTLKFKEMEYAKHAVSQGSKGKGVSK